MQAGDTLIGVQQRLLRPGVDWRLLQRLGRIAEPRRLQPGTVLRIPLHLLREQAAAAEVLHVHGQTWLERGGTRQPAAPLATLATGLAAALWSHQLQQQARERALAQQLAVAAETARAKSEFLSNVSHEIRTPMNALLDLSSIEAGHLELHPAPFSTRHLLSHLAALLRPRAEAKGLLLRIDSAPDLPDGVLGHW